MGVRIDEILSAGSDPVFSFEFFPPKTPAGEANLYAAVEQLRPLDPAYVSVTYGAGGSTRGKTLEIVSRIRDEYGLEAMAHFTCVGATVDELRSTLQRGALVDVALVGQFATIDRRWLRQQEHPLDLHARAGIGGVVGG